MHALLDNMNISRILFSYQNLFYLSQSNSKCIHATIIKHFKKCVKNILKCVQQLEINY